MLPECENIGDAKWLNLGAYTSKGLGFTVFCSHVVTVVLHLQTIIVFCNRIYYVICYFYYHRSRAGSVFTSVCLLVCLSVDSKTCH